MIAHQTNACEILVSCLISEGGRNLWVLIKPIDKDAIGWNFINKKVLDNIKCK